MDLSQIETGVRQAQDGVAARQTRAKWAVLALLGLQLLFMTAPSQRVILPVRLTLREHAVTYRALLISWRRHQRLDTDARLLRRVRRIERRILLAAARLYPSTRQVAWRVHTVRGLDNAASTADGHIAVGSRLVSELRLTDDELAFVLAHETAHVLHRDIPHQLANENRIERLFRAVETASNLYIASSGLCEWWATLAMRLPEERRAERRADGLGFVLMTMAGYNPRGALRYFRKSQHHWHDDWLDPVLSGHPTTVSRIDHVRALLTLNESRTDD